MKILRLLYFCIILFAAGCNSYEPSSHVGEIMCMEINVDITSADFLAPEQVVEKKVVQLETGDNCLFGDIAKLYVAKDRIFVLDSQIAEGLFVFDMEGKFLFAINHKGQGPGEFYSINDFFVDTLNLCIAIYDANMRNLHYHDWNGKYTHTHSFSDFWAFACCPIDSLTYALDFTNREMKTNKFHLLLMDENNKVFFRYKPLETDYGLANNNHIAFYHTYEKTYYTPTGCDTIFEISNKGIERELWINFGKNKVPSSFYKDTPYSKHAANLLNSKYCHGVRNIAETSDMLSFQYNYGDIGLAAFFDKKLEKTYRDVSFFPPPLTSYEDYFVGILNAYSVVQIIERKQDTFFDKWKEALGEENWPLLQSVKDNDNPLIVFYKLKL